MRGTIDALLRVTTSAICGTDLHLYKGSDVGTEPGTTLGHEFVAGRGHAIECRINAEDPTGGRFLPAPGRITRLAVPQGPGVRWDGGYETGDEVTPYYDNLIGKLVVWGPDRDTARARLRRALRELRVEGVATTIPAHEAIIDHPEFVAGGCCTRFLEDRLDLSGLPPAPAVTAPEAETRSRQEVRVAGRWYTVPRFDPTAPAAGAAGRVSTGGPPRAAAGTRSPVGRSRVAGYRVAGAVTSQMQGTVVKVLVEVGDVVEARQPVCVMEAMKMEAVLTAPQAGTVAEVPVAPGQAVRAGEVLVGAPRRRSRLRRRAPGPLRGGPGR